VILAWKNCLNSSGPSRVRQAVELRWRHDESASGLENMQIARVDLSLLEPMMKVWGNGQFPRSVG
jgi:hypothetical protein